MEYFALAQIENRIARARTELARVMADPSGEPIHDLRVSIRRVEQALRLFGRIYGENRSSHLRARLRPVIKAAGEVRNNDIALKLLSECECPADVAAGLARRFHAQRARDTGILRLRIAQSGPV